MIKARAELTDGRTLIVFGLSQENRLRLGNGEPIFIEGVQLGCHDMVFLIYGGETEEELKKTLLDALRASKAPD